MRIFCILICTLCSGGLTRAQAVVVNSGIVYAQGAVRAPVAGHKNLTLDLYRSTGKTNGCALVLIHGGSFTGGSSTSLDMVDAGNYFAARGWTCVAINYRLAGDDPPAPLWMELIGQPELNATHAAVVDSKRAIRWLRSNAAVYGIDSNRVASLGHSAGAYCSLMCAITDREDFANDAGTAVPDLLPGYSGKVNACTEVSGQAGLSLSEITADDPPILIWHGTADSVVDHGFARDIEAACVSNSVPVWFKSLPGIEHGAPTWLATSEGRDVKSWSEDLFNRFFQLELTAVGPDQLQWPSVDGARYQLAIATNLTEEFAPQAGVLVSTGELMQVTTPGGSVFVTVNPLSGQP